MAWKMENMAEWLGSEGLPAAQQELIQGQQLGYSKGIVYSKGEEGHPPSFKSGEEALQGTGHETSVAGGDRRAQTGYSTPPRAGGQSEVEEIQRGTTAAFPKAESQDRRQQKQGGVTQSSAQKGYQVEDKGGSAGGRSLFGLFRGGGCNKPEKVIASPDRGAGGLGGFHVGGQVPVFPDTRPTIDIPAHSLAFRMLEHSMELQRLAIQLLESSKGFANEEKVEQCKKTVSPASPSAQLGAFAEPFHNELDEQHVIHLSRKSNGGQGVSFSGVSIDQIELDKNAEGTLSWRCQKRISWAEATLDSIDQEVADELPEEKAVEEVKVEEKPPAELKTTEPPAERKLADEPKAEETAPRRF